MKRTTQSQQRGYTIIEAFIVIILTVILAMIVIALFIREDPKDERKSSTSSAGISHPVKVPAHPGHA